jgi:hypothetical protein
MQRVLKPVCSPILAHIRRWIADGELEDPYNEFFIENDASKLDHNWVSLVTPNLSPKPQILNCKP